jgi:hypothetical protein
MGLGSFLGRPAVQTGAVVGAAVLPEVADLIGKAFNTLTNAGLSTDQAHQILTNPQNLVALTQSQVQPTGGNALAGLGRIGQEASGEVLGALINKGLGGSVTAGAYNAVSPDSLSKYLIDPSVGIAYTQYERPEAYRTALFNATLGRIPGVTPLEAPTSTSEFLAEAQRRNEEMMTSATERKIAELRANREFDKLIAGIQAEATVRQQETASLGDIQRQRVESGYDYAKNLLNSAINNVYERAKLENSPITTELAKIQ